MLHCQSRFLLFVAFWLAGVQPGVSDLATLGRTAALGPRLPTTESLARSVQLRCGAEATGGARDDDDEADGGYELFSTSFNAKDVLRSVWKVVTQLVKLVQQAFTSDSLARSFQSASRAAALEGKPLLVFMWQSESPGSKASEAVAKLAEVLHEDPGLAESVANGTLSFWEGKVQGSQQRLVKSVIRPRRWPILALLRSDGQDQYALLYRHSCNPVPKSGEAFRRWLWAGQRRAKADTKLQAARERFLEKQLVLQQQKEYIQATVEDRHLEEETKRQEQLALEKALAQKARKEWKRAVKSAKAELDSAEPPLEAPRSEITRLVLRQSRSTEDDSKRLLSGPTSRRFWSSAPLSLLSTWCTSEGIDLSAGQYGLFSEGSDGEVVELDLGSEESLKEVGLAPKGKVLIQELRVHEGT